MPKVPIEYWNALSSQILLISALLGGFSIAIIANLLVSEKDSKIINQTFRLTIGAAASFMVSLFAMTQIYLQTTPGFPGEAFGDGFNFARISGFISFLIGIFCVMAVLAKSGFAKSKSMGVFTTVISLVALVTILFMMVG